MSSAHASAATATASVYFSFALYTSAPPAFFYFFTELVMAASLPVLFLALGAAVACAAAAAFLAQGQAKLGGADGALCEDHLAFTIALQARRWAALPSLALEQASGP